MFQKKLKLGIVLLFGLCLKGLQAQENIPASGGEASGSGGLVSYSVGQIFYITNSGINVSVAQGIQQPFEISVVSGIKIQPGISLTISIYPNPATDYLTLRIENFNKENLTYKILDINGKLLMNKKIIGNETSIDMSQLIPATYFLNINNDKKEVKTFKVIKN